MSDLSVPVDNISPEFHNSLSRLAKDGLKSPSVPTVLYDWDSMLPQLEASRVDLDLLTDTGSVYIPEETSPLNHVRCSGITQNADLDGHLLGVNTFDNLHSERPVTRTRLIEPDSTRMPWTDYAPPDPTDFITTDRTRQKLVRSSATQRGNTVYYSQQPERFRRSVRQTSHIQGSASFQEKLIPPCALAVLPESKITSHSLEDDLWTVGSKLGVFFGGVKGEGFDGPTVVQPRTAHNIHYACYPDQYDPELPIRQRYSIQSEGAFDFHGCTSQHPRRSFPKSALEQLTPPRPCTLTGKNNHLPTAETVSMQHSASAKLKSVRWALKISRAT
ncbi:hypothetical protein AHF37_11717 [Paragonimus kellicotti]|nr:hypothetical protein AHF37_11717 [Paragonimus kellicotti]